MKKVQIPKFKFQIKRELTKAIAIISIFLLNFVLTPVYAAGALASLSNTMSRLKTGEASNHTFKFTTPTVLTDTTDKIEITFPAGFTVGSVDYTDIDLSHGASTGYETEETLAAAADGTNWGAAFSGQVLTLDHPTNAANGDIAINDKIIIEIGLNAAGGNAQITNPSSNTYVIDIKTKDGATETDTGKVAVAIVDNDEFTVNASVNPTITFNVSTTSTSFTAPLSSTSVTSTSTVTLTTSTNAEGGYTITVQDQGNGTNPGLWSAAANFLIGSANYSYGDSADLGSVAGYGLQGSSSTATISTSPINYSVTGNNVGGLERTAQALASYGDPADAQTVDLLFKAKVTGSTPAGSYIDTIRVIATANF